MDFFTTLGGITEIDFAGFLTCSNRQYLPETSRIYSTFLQQSTVIDDAMKVISQHEELKLVTKLLRLGVMTLGKFKCNKDIANRFRERLARVASFLSEEYTEASAHWSKEGKEYPIESIISMENCLYEWLRYIVRFTEDDYPNYLILGNEPKKIFDHFDSDLIHCILSICSHYEIEHPERFIALSTTPTKFLEPLSAVTASSSRIATTLSQTITSTLLSATGASTDHSSHSATTNSSALITSSATFHSYNITHSAFFSCNLLPIIKKLTVLEGSNKSQYQAKYTITLDAMLSRRGIDDVTDELRNTVRKDMKSVELTVNQLTTESTELITIKQYHMIKQRALREFWLTKVHPKLSVSLKKLSLLVQTYLSARGAGSVLAIDLANIFKNCAAVDTDETGHVDCYSIARLGRKVRAEEVSFIEVVKEIADIHRTIILPPLYGSAIVRGSAYDEVILDAGQEERIVKLFHRVGWSVISGPKLSGKSCRLLHCLHTKCPSDEKDIIWIDFDGIVSEMDGISRISQLLYFRKCQTFAELEIRLNAFLSSLRIGSVVVLDNVRLTHKRLQGIGTGQLSLQDCDKTNQQKIISFYKKLIQSCKVHSRLLSFIVVTDFPEFLTKEVHFLDNIHIGPLSDISANKLIQAIERGTPNIDYEALKHASSNLSGLMHSLAATCSLRIIRKIANTVNECIDTISNSNDNSNSNSNSNSNPNNNNINSNNNNNTVNNREAITTFALCEAMKTVYTGYLTEDERILATCLDTNWSYFDEALSWAMSKEQFQNNIVRWRLAWNGLVNSHWIIYDIELGYKCSYLASLIQPQNGVLSPQMLFDTYFLYLSREVVRMNDANGNWSCGLEYFSKYISHYNHILYCSYIRNKSQTQSHHDDSMFALHFDHMFSDITLHLFDNKSNATAAATAPTTATAATSVATGKSIPTKPTTADSGDVHHKHHMDLDDYYDEEQIHQATASASTTAAAAAAAAAGAGGASGAAVGHDAINDRFISPIVFVDVRHYQSRVRKPSEAAVLRAVNVIAGHLSNVVTYNLPIATAKALTNAIMNVPGAFIDSGNADNHNQGSNNYYNNNSNNNSNSSSSHSMNSKMSEALLDHCEQEARDNEYSLALHRIQPMISHINTTFLQQQHAMHISPDKIPIYAPRALLLQGQLLQQANDMSNARYAYSNAIKLFTCKGLTAENSWQCALAVSKHDNICAMLANLPNTGSASSIVDLAKLTGSGSSSGSISGKHGSSTAASVRGKGLATSADSSNSSNWMSRMFSK